MATSRHLFVILVFCLLSSLSSALTPPHGFQDFTELCALRAKEAYHNETTSDNKNRHSKLQFVDEHGTFNPDLGLAGAVGVTTQTCSRLCGDIPLQFSFATFATSMFNWLLPWVILIAQFPYETSGPFNNVLSVLLALGSPAFVTYSLIVTLTNRFRVAENFQILHDLSRDPKVKARYPRMTDRLDAARYLLSESQQSPMRASNDKGWLANLLFGENNWVWWQHVKKDLNNTRRKPTLSLILQLLYAFIAWLFTVIVAFGKLGTVTIGLSIASSSIFAWMIPVVMGWVAVGTQVRPRSIRDALHWHADRVKTADEEAPHNGGFVTDLQMGIAARSGINTEFLMDRPPAEFQHMVSHPEDIELQTVTSMTSSAPTLTKGQSRLDSVASYATAKIHDDHHQTCHIGTLLNKRMPSRWSFSLAGDEAKEGPIYNYARIFTFSHFAATIERGFQEGLSRIRADESVDPTNLSEFAGFEQPIKAYPEWSEIDPKVWRNMITAILVGLFVQWGTSGPSIMLDYLTPAAGLGCRSTTHLLYAVVATLAFACLQISSVLSHALMLRFQRDPSQAPGGFTFFSFIILRLIGNTIASLNALWIVVASGLQLSGVYDTCWCNGYSGWVLLFPSADQLAPSARDYWVGAVVFSSIVCFLASVFICLGCKRCNQRFE